MCLYDVDNGWYGPMVTMYIGPRVTRYIVGLSQLPEDKMSWGKSKKLIAITSRVNANLRALALPLLIAKH